MALDAEKRIPDTTLPANSFKDGDILYGLDMNRVVDTLKTAVNENYKDLKGAVKGGDSIYINPIEGVVDAEGQPIDTVDGLIKWLYDNKILNEGKIYSLRINDSKQFEYYDGESWKLATVGQQGEPGEGVPTGGLSGQFLRKQSDVSYDTEWVDAYDKPQVDGKINNLKTIVTKNTNDIIRLNKFSILTLGTSWEQDITNGYYTQSLALGGITSKDNPIIDVVLSDTLEEMQTQQEEWSKILKVETSDDGLTFYASEATTTSLDLIIKMSAVTKSDADDIQTELIDIRVGYDGTTYDSAGNAVRTQVTTLNTKINDATSELKSEKADKVEVSELKSDLSNKITKFYASNQGETHITDSDNGKIQDMMIYGKSEQFTTTGKNLLKIRDGTQTLRGVTITAKDGVVALKGTATETGWSILDIDSFVLDGRYTLSSNSTNIVEVILASKSFKTVIQQNQPATLENKEVSKICFTVTNGKTYDISNVLIQLEKGSEATSYEPYTGGIPSPSPNYPQEIKSVVNPKLEVCGKNLLNPTLQTTTKNNVICTNNGDGTYTLNGTATAQTNFTLMNQTVNAFIGAKILGCPSGGGDLKYSLIISYFDENGSWKNEKYDTGSGIIIKDFPKIQMGILIRSGVTCDNLLFKPMITRDLNATYDDFEPYKEQSATLPYTLNAIPVTSGGNITIDGQQYIADYVDIEGKKLHRLLEKVNVLDLQLKDDGIAGECHDFLTDLEKYDSNNYIARKIPIASNKFISNKNTLIGVNEVVYRTVSDAGWEGNSRLMFRVPSEINTLDLFKQYVGNDCYVIYPSKEPTIINLTDEEVEAFKNLITYYPTTNISVNSEQLDGYTIFNYPISMQNGWNYVKQQLNDNRDYIYDMDTQSAEAYVNSEYAVALTELEV